jgi:hypothetical protein
VRGRGRGRGEGEGDGEGDGDGEGAELWLTFSRQFPLLPCYLPRLVMSYSTFRSHPRVAAHVPVHILAHKGGSLPHNTTTWVKNGLCHIAGRRVVTGDDRAELPAGRGSYRASSTAQVRISQPRR